jgi:hypothetical protein
MDPELRPFRARIGQLAIFATFTALCVWLIVDLMQLWRSELIRYEDLWFDFLSILFLSEIGLCVMVSRFFQLRM